VLTTSLRRVIFETYMRENYHRICHDIPSGHALACMDGLDVCRAKKVPNFNLL
jgi:hypothetical protein